MLIEYAGGNKLYVPLSRMDLVQRFRGEGEAKPTLDKMGGATWSRTRTRIKTKMRDMAEELLKLYAARRLAPGFAFSPDSNWQREFEDAFEFTETRDQKTAIDGHQARHGKPAADGPPALRRRRLRQDRSRHARGVQGHGRWQAGRRARAHHRALLPAFRDVQEALPAVPRAHRNAQPLPQREGDQSRARRISRRAKSIWWSARIGCSRRTSSGRISAS